MPKYTIDIDEIDLQPNEHVWLNVGSYKILVQGNGRMVFHDINQILADLTIDQLVKATDESRNSGN